jgi:hypothetical protein
VGHSIVVDRANLISIAAIQGSALSVSYGRSTEPYIRAALNNGFVEPLFMRRTIFFLLHIRFNQILGQERILQNLTWCFILFLMTKLLNEAFSRMSELPDDRQDTAAKQLMRYVEEITTLNEQAAIAEGRAAFARGDTFSLDQWRHDMGLADH